MVKQGLDDGVLSSFDIVLGGKSYHVVLWRRPVAVSPVKRLDKKYRGEGKRLSSPYRRRTWCTECTGTGEATNRRRTKQNGRFRVIR